MSALTEALERIAQSPSGPTIGAFFDYDGTLIDGYSAGAYFVDRLKRRGVSRRELIDTVKLMRKGDLTEAEFGDVIGKAILDWAGQTEDQMHTLWRRLFLERTATTLFPETWKLVQAHQKKGHTVAIASSATPYQLQPLAQEYGIEHLICTQPKIRSGKLTGGIDGKPMWGSGKADGTRAFAKAHGIQLKNSFGYANGNEDIPFLEGVGHPTAVQPKEQLEQVAKDKSWPILRFDRRHRGSVKAMARTAGAYGAMGAALLAGIGFAKATGQHRRAVDLITSVASDSALKVLGVDVDVVGEANLWDHRPCVFIANHQSKFDFFLVMHLVRRGFSGVAKKEAASTPGFGAYMKMADFAFVDRSNSMKAIDAMKPAVERLQRGLCVCIAPEGTRSWTPRLGKFKKGAFHMAQQAGVPVVPVVIRNAGEIMGRNDQTMRSGTVQVAVLPKIDVSGWRPEEFEARIEEVRQMYIETLDHWPKKAQA